MADPRAFISFDFDNNSDHRTLFTGQIKNSRTPFAVQDWSSKIVLAQRTWESQIKTKMNSTNMCIVLVGKSMSTATGVAKEIKMAQECNVPIFGVYVDGAGTTSTLPTGLSRSQVIYWDWAQIASMVDQMMKQGKNKT
jgi:hypothetical protein